MSHDTLNETIRRIRDILDQATGQPSAAAGACCTTASRSGCCDGGCEPGCCASTVTLGCGCR